MDKIYIAFQRHTSDSYDGDSSVLIILGTYTDVEVARKRITERANEKKAHLEEVVKDFNFNTEINFEDSGNGYIELSYMGGAETYEFFVNEYDINKDTFDSIA